MWFGVHTVENTVFRIKIKITHFAEVWKQSVSVNTTQNCHLQILH